MNTDLKRMSKEYVVSEFEGLCLNLLNGPSKTIKIQNFGPEGLQNSKQK